LSIHGYVVRLIKEGGLRAREYPNVVVRHAGRRVVSDVLIKMLSDRDPRKVNRVMDAVFKMKKIDIPAAQKPYDQQ